MFDDTLELELDELLDELLNELLDELELDEELVVVCADLSASIQVMELQDILPSWWYWTWSL